MPSESFINYEPVGIGIPGLFDPPTAWSDLLLNITAKLRTKSVQMVGGPGPGIPVYPLKLNEESLN